MELEAEMQAHRYAAGDIEDISAIDSRMRSQSHSSNRNRQLNQYRRNHSQIETISSRQNARSRYRRSLDSMHGEDEPTLSSDQTRRPLPFLRPQRSPQYAPRPPPGGAVAGGEEWLALHDMLVNARHEEVGISGAHLARLEERMLMQVI